MLYIRNISCYNLLALISGTRFLPDMARFERLPFPSLMARQFLTRWSNVALKQGPGPTLYLLAVDFALLEICVAFLEDGILICH